MIRAAALSLVLTACGPALTPPPGEAPVLERSERSDLVLVADDGEVTVGADPYAPAAARRADYDVNATLIARDVALVVEPATRAPIYVSNLLGGALVRRFGGHLPLNQALGAEEVFFIRPALSGGPVHSGFVIVDWAIWTEDRDLIGVVYAERRLSGAVESDPWDAFTRGDAEHLALQAASDLVATPAISEAIMRATDRAALKRTPTPAARPQAPGAPSRLAAASAPRPTARPRR